MLQNVSNDSVSERKEGDLHSGMGKSVMTPCNCQYSPNSNSRLLGERTVSFDVFVIVPGNTQVCVGSDVICHRPPTYSLRSNVVTSKPSSTKFLVAIKPRGPAPTIATLFRKPSEPRFVIVQSQKVACSIACKKKLINTTKRGFFRLTFNITIFYIYKSSSGCDLANSSAQGKLSVRKHRELRYEAQEMAWLRQQAPGSHFSQVILGIGYRFVRSFVGREDNPPIPIILQLTTRFPQSRNPNPVIPQRTQVRDTCRAVVTAAFSAGISCSQWMSH